MNRKKEKELVFWRKHGFKKLVGGLLSIIGGVICLIPFKNQGMFYIGAGIAGVGTALMGVGVVHTAVKINKDIPRNDSVWRELSDRVRTNNFFRKEK